MNKLKSILLDDEAEGLRRMELLLEKFPAIQNLGSFTDPKEAITAILQHEPDILFVDIQMPEMTGFEVVKQLHTCGARPFIVFVTAFDQFAIKAIKAGAFDYLLKPVEEDELLSVIGRIHMERGVPDMSFRLHQIEKVINNQRKIIFSTRSGYFMLRPEEILYIEASSNYSEVHLVVPRREVVSMNLGAVQEVLPSQFIRISRSVIINSDYLVKVSGANKRCVLKAGTEEIEFSIPEKQLPELRKALENL